MAQTTPILGKMSTLQELPETPTGSVPETALAPEKRHVIQKVGSKPENL